MIVVHVNIQVKEESIHDFIAATLENAANSLKEPGIARFDVLQMQNDTSRFVLTEVYRSAADTARHKETDHYKKWRAAVEEMMASPRFSERFTNMFPPDEDWV